MDAKKKRSYTEDAETTEVTEKEGSAENCGED